MRSALAVWLQRENSRRETKQISLESDSDVHASDDEDIPPQTDRDTDNDADDITDTKCANWTDRTQCQLAVLVVHGFTRGRSELRQTEAPHNTGTRLAFYAVTFFRLHNFWRKRELLSPVLAHTGRRAVRTA